MAPSRRAPYDPDAYATDSIPEFSEPLPPRNGNGGGGGHGIIGFLKFLVFALDPRRRRPRGRPDGAPSGRRQHGHDRRRGQSRGAQPAVRRGHRSREPRCGAHHAGLDRDRPRSSSWSSPATRRRPSRTGSRSRACSATAGRSCSSRPIDKLTGSLQAGHLRPAQEHDARSAGPGAARPAGGQVRRHRPAHGPPARADHRQAREPQAGPADGRVGVLRHRHVAAAGPPRRLSVAPDDPQGRAEGRLARRFPVAGDVPRPARHDARGARPADARQLRAERRRRSGWPSPRTAA